VQRDFDGAVAAADRAVEAIEGRGGRLREIEIVMRWAWVHAAIGRTPPAEIEARVRSVMGLVAESGAWSREPFLRLVLAWAHRRAGRQDSAVEETRRALDDLDAMGWWDAPRLRMLEAMRERLGADQQHRLWSFLSEFRISSRSGPALLP